MQNSFFLDDSAKDGEKEIYPEGDQASIDSDNKRYIYANVRGRCKAFRPFARQAFRLGYGRRLVGHFPHYSVVGEI